MSLRVWYDACVAASTVGLAVALWLTTGQVAALRAQVRHSRAVYVQQERNDRQAVHGLGRSLDGIVRRDVAAACVRLR